MSLSVYLLPIQEDAMEQTFHRRTEARDVEMSHEHLVVLHITMDSASRAEKGFRCYGRHGK